MVLGVIFYEINIVRSRPFECHRALSRDARESRPR
jgi:hypothetical protein